MPLLRMSNCGLQDVGIKGSSLNILGDELKERYI